MKTNARSQRKVRRRASTVAFEVLHNGSKVARAGIPGDGVVSVSVDWTRDSVTPTEPEAQTESPHGGLRLHIGAVDRADHVWNHHLAWATQELVMGDRIEIRVADGARVDTPTWKRSWRIRARPKPPPEGDSSRRSVREAVVWMAPKGLYLKALGTKNGGAVVLSRREARELATALQELATQPRRRRRSRPT